MRDPEITDEEIIAAGQRLESRGRKVTKTSLRSEAGGGNSERVLEVWLSHKDECERRRRRFPISLPKAITSSVAPSRGSIARCATSWRRCGPASKMLQTGDRPTRNRHASSACERHKKILQRQKSRSICWIFRSARTRAACGTVQTGTTTQAKADDQKQVDRSREGDDRCRRSASAQAQTELLHIITMEKPRQINVTCYPT